MTRFHFIADNKTQLEALKECGVKNVSLSYKFFHSNINNLREHFDSIILNAGSGKKNFESIEYYEFIKSLEDDVYNFAFQYDEAGEIKRTMSYYHQALEMDLDFIVPILHENYEVHLNYIKPILRTDILALGKCSSVVDEDKGFEILKGQYQIHGLGKARWIKLDNPPASVDSPTWLNPVKNGKLQVVLRDGNEEVSIRDLKAIANAIEDNKEFAEKCNVKISGIMNKDHKTLLRASMALHYMPQFDKLKILGDNFN